MEPAAAARRVERLKSRVSQSKTGSLFWSLVFSGSCVEESYLLQRNGFRMERDSSI